jgi:hypothetical protein
MYGLARESQTIVVRRDSEQPDKSSAQSLLVLETTPTGDTFQLDGASFDQSTRFLHADSHDKGRGCHARVCGEFAREVSDTEIRVSGESIDGEIFVDVFEHPQLELPKAIFSSFGLKVSTEL